MRYAYAFQGYAHGKRRLLLEARRYAPLPKAFARLTSKLILACFEEVADAGLPGDECRERKQQLQEMLAAATRFEAAEVRARACPRRTLPHEPSLLPRPANLKCCPPLLPRNGCVR